MIFEGVFTRDGIQKVSDPFGCEMIFEGVFTRDRSDLKSIGSIWMRNDL